MIASGVTYSSLEVTLAQRTVVYPQWGNILGWMFVVGAFLWVPGYATYAVFIKFRHISSWKQRLAVVISPEHEHESIISGLEPSRYQVREKYVLY